MADWTDIPARADGVDPNAAADINSLMDNCTIAAPRGAVQMFAGSSAPDGWLICDGSSLLRATYADLFAVIGTTFGAADGTHFNLPDCRGLFVRGAGENDDSLTGIDDAGGDPYDGGSLGDYAEDQGQGHKHQYKDVINANIGAGANSCIQSTGGVASTDDLIDVPIADGTNGTPRTGVETKPASVALHYIIKY